MSDIAVRDYGNPAYFLGEDFHDFCIVDPILPSAMLSASQVPRIVGSAYSPLTWASIDRSQLCFENGPIERTDLKRWIGLWGQVALDFALGGTPEEVERNFSGDYRQDALHRVYSHSSDFLIQSFMGAQDAHDEDAKAILEVFDRQAGYSSGPDPIQLSRRVNDGYPDLNIDRLEFGLRQQYGMGWLPMERYNTKLNLQRLVTVQEDGSLAFIDEEFGLIFCAGFSYLGSENWLNPLQRAELLNQQYELKHRMSFPGLSTLADRIARQHGNKRAHPYDGLYDAEWSTAPESYKVNGDQTSRDIALISGTLSSSSRARGRVSQMTEHINKIVLGGRSACNFVHPLTPFGEGEAVPLGITIVPVECEGSPSIKYDKNRNALVYTLPGGMKPRVLDPQVAGGTRLSAIDAYANFKGDYEMFVRQGFEVVVHGVSSEFGNRFMDEIKKVNQTYEEALQAPKLEAAEVAQIIEYVGRLSFSFSQGDNFMQGSSYPFKIWCPNRLIADNNARLVELRNSFFA